MHFQRALSVPERIIQCPLTRLPKKEPLPLGRGYAETTLQGPSFLGLNPFRSQIRHHIHQIRFFSIEVFFCPCGFGGSPGLQPF